MPMISDKAPGGCEKKKPIRRDALLAVIILLCAAIVIFWEIMANRNKDLSRVYLLTSADFADFNPNRPSWFSKSLPVNADPMEPIIVSYELQFRGDETELADFQVPDSMKSLVGTQAIYSAVASVPVLVRLVHGYNMPDCMRIKWHKVELVADLRQRTEGRSRRSEVRDQKAEDRGQRTEGGGQRTEIRGQRSEDGEASVHSSSFPRVQIWKLTSSLGEVSIWVTGMLKADDFGETDIDTRSMAFPRIGIPDDPNWMPRGFTLGSLRHPVKNLRSLLRAKWNNAHCDIWAFLGLKRPAGASDEFVTLVTTATTSFSETGAGTEETASGIGDSITQALVAYSFMLDELQSWRNKKP